MFAHTDKSLLYTRNLIDTDHETYSLLLLCWNPGKESPIHDHPRDGCWVKVITGAIQECRYRKVGNDEDAPLHCYQNSIARKGNVTYIDDSQGLHKVGNPTSEIAITLHLYSPPAQYCKTWSSEISLPEESLMENYSEYGSII